MLWTFTVVLFIVWALGMSFKVTGALMHPLLAVAVVLLVVGVVRGRRSMA